MAAPLSSSRGLHEEELVLSFDPSSLIIYFLPNHPIPLPPTPSPSSSSPLLPPDPGVIPERRPGDTIPELRLRSQKRQLQLVLGNGRKANGGSEVALVERGGGAEGKVGEKASAAGESREVRADEDVACRLDWSHGLLGLSELYDRGLERGQISTSLPSIGRSNTMSLWECHRKTCAKPGSLPIAIATGRRRRERSAPPGRGGRWVPGGRLKEWRAWEVGGVAVGNEFGAGRQHSSYEEDMHWRE